MITLTLLALLLIPCVLIGGGLALFWKTRRRSILRWSAVSYLSLVTVVLFGIGPFVTAYSLVHSGSRPMDRQLKDTPADWQVPYEDVVFETRDSLRLSGWFVPPKDQNAILICTHGLFRNRVELLSRLMPLAKTGYGALLFDARSHGSSQKGLVSLGYYERNDVLGAMQYVRRRYQDAAEQPKIVLLGVSMGAMALLEAGTETRNYAAVILDSPFLSLRDTVVHHSWLLFKLPKYPFPTLFLFWFEREAGFDADRLDARNAIQKIEPVPLLIIASEGDERMGPGVAQELYSLSRSPMKQLKVFGKDVTHGAAARLHPEQYNALLTEFLEGALGGEPGGVKGDIQAAKEPSASEGFPK
jgi:pimeloyl-ACP methyl ester carboxylesterase